MKRSFRQKTSAIALRRGANSNVWCRKHNRSEAEHDRICRRNRISRGENVEFGPHQEPLGARKNAPPIPFKIQNSKLKTRKASSLITALLVLVVLSTIVVAFMQSMSIERSVSRSVMNKEKAVLAAESGLDAVLAKIAGSTSTNFAVAQDRSNADPRSWSTIFIQMNGSGIAVATNSLSDVGLPVITNYVFRLATNIEKVASVHPVLDLNGGTNGSFAFVVIDNTAKQNLIRYPAISPRGYTTTLREVPLVLPNLTPLSASQSNVINTAADSPSYQNELMSVSTFNQFFGANDSPKASEGWAATESWAASVAPDGQPKINLRRLKYYLDGLSVSQISGNPKSTAIEGLLGQPSGFSTNWGGGTLEWLISPNNPGRYSAEEARQIAANLIDYLDDDLHPTTDNVDSPTYFGVEGRFQPDGTVSGHPFITALGFGLIINSSQSAGFRGQLNSTRVLSYLSIVNPWSARLADFHSRYTVEYSDIRVEGTAFGGNLGTNASTYFPTAFDPNNVNSRLGSGPNNLDPFSGAIYPGEPNGLNYRGDKDFLPNRQPAGMRFEELGFRIGRIRIVFNSSDSSESVVQTLDNLNSFIIPMVPSNYTVPSSGEIRVFSPGSVREMLLLSSDPRMNYSSNAWTTNQLTASEAAGSQPPGQARVNIFSQMSSSQGDGRQGVPPVWVGSPNLTNHFFVRSPARIGDPSTTPYNPANSPAQLAVDSIAEIGYLWTGRPWQTLRMVEPTNAPFRKDYLLLGYLDAGTFKTKTNSVGQFMTDGQINVGTALLPTLRGMFSDIPNQAAATNLSTFFSSTTNRYPYINPGAIGELTNMATPGVNTKFAREDLMRRVANGLTTRSEDFTVFVRGEARDPRILGRVISTATLTAEIRLVYDRSNPNNPPNVTVIRKTTH